MLEGTSQIFFHISTYANEELSQPFQLSNKGNLSITLVQSTVINILVSAEYAVLELRLQIDQFKSNYKQEFSVMVF